MKMNLVKDRVDTPYHVALLVWTKDGMFIFDSFVGGDVLKSLVDWKRYGFEDVSK
jgi:hypothetical protein